jgi:hypothetical protein
VSDLGMDEQERRRWVRDAIDDERRFRPAMRAFQQEYE